MHELEDLNPPMKNIRSRFAGDFLMDKEETWPTWNNKPLQSILQINLSELPYVPEAIQGFQFITIFIDIEDIPFRTTFRERMGNTVL